MLCSRTESPRKLSKCNSCNWILGRQWSRKKSPDSYAILFFAASDFTLSPITSTTGCCFCFGSVSSFFLELFLYPSSVAYSAPTNLGSSYFSVLSFCLFILFMGFSRQEYWSGLLFPSPVDHILSELSIMTHLSRVTLQVMAQSFIALDKAVVHVIRFFNFLWLWFSFSLPYDGEG